MNPQIRFGEDLMSRVSYAMLHEDGAADMTPRGARRAGRAGRGLVERAGVARDDVLDLVLVGNPIMHHLVLGLDPVPLGSAPFALATDEPVRTTAGELGLRLRPGARVYVLPCIAGHVGADTAGMILADEPHLAEPVRLLVDVGHQRGDRPGQPRSAARGVEPHRARLRGRPDQRRPAGGPGRRRAGPHRPRVPGAPVQGHRLRCAGPTTRASPRHRPGSASRASAAPGSSRPWPSCSSRAS